MRTRPVRVLGGWLVAGAWLAVAGARADLPAGPAMLKPRIAVSGAYDDNIFLRPSSLVGSGILTASPGLGVWLANDRTRFVVDYQYDFIHYDRFPSVNDAQHQTGAVQVQHAFTDDAWVSAGDTFLVTTDPASSELVDRAIRDQNTVDLGLELPLGPVFFVGLVGSDAAIHYHTALYSDLLSRTELNGGPRLGVAITEKTRAYAFYRYQSVKYSSSPTGFARDSTGGQAGLGLEGQPSERTSVALEVGVLMRTYVHTVVDDANGVSTAGVNLRFSWTTPGDYVVHLEGGLEPQESIFTRYYLSNSGAASVGKRLAPRWDAAVSAGYGEDHYSADFPLFAGTFDSLGFPQFTLVRRLDRLTQAGAELGYQLYDNQRLTARYLYRNRSSNIAAYAYKDNTITVAADYLF